MLPDFLLPIILFFLFFFVIPQAWKEENSFIGAVLKFWFLIVPFMMGAAGLFSMFIGPLYAIIGLFQMEYILVTILYLYLFILYSLDYFLRRNHPEFHSKLQTI